MPATDDPLVSTDWLAAHIDDPKVRVIDATFKCPAYCRCRRTTISRRIFPTRCSSSRHGLRSAVRGRNVSGRKTVRPRGLRRSGFPRRTVVAYDAGGWVAAPRAWWMFLSFGYHNVKVLDGGLKKWLPRGPPTQSGKVTPKPGKVRGQARSATRSQPAASTRQLDSRAEQWSIAPAPRFEGSVAEPRPGLRSGHIPGSRNVP